MWCPQVSWAGCPGIGFENVLGQAGTGAEHAVVDGRVVKGGWRRR